MYNTDFPQRADLPSAAQLKTSTLLAAAVATTLLVAVILPADYAVDPTGIGRMLGLTRMGEIKVQLAEEARKGGDTPPPLPKEVVGQLERIEARLVSLERLLAVKPRGGPPAAAADGSPRSPNSLETLLEEKARASRVGSEGSSGAPTATGSTSTLGGTPQVQPRTTTPNAPPAKTAGSHGFREDNVSVKLAPGEGAEFKMTMTSGAQVQYHWASRGGTANYDLHGTPIGGGAESRYKLERGVAGDQGALTAGFDGAHGWFFRNRGDKPIEIVLYTGGNYGEMKRVK